MGISMIAAYRYMYMYVFMYIVLHACLCRHAKGSKPEVTLYPCSPTPDESLFANCTEHDTTGDTYHLGDNITATLIIKFPVLVLTELWKDQRKVAIVTAGGDTISNGQETIDSQDRDRWALDFNFKNTDNGYGKLMLTLHIQNVEYRDERLLHVEVRTENTTFKTRGKTWISVDVNNNDQATEPIMEEVTTHKHTEYGNVQKEQIDALKQNISALQKILMTTKDDLLYYQHKYIKSLEIINSAQENKMNTYRPFRDNLTIIGVVCILAVIAVYMYAHVHVYRNYKLGPGDVIDGTEMNKWYTLAPRSITTITEDKQPPGNAQENEDLLANHPFHV